MHGVFDARLARRLDPTGTNDLRAKFRGELDKRWSRLRQMVTQAILVEDLLGLGPTNVQTIARSVDPVNEFSTWLRSALDRIVISGDGSWTQHFLDEAAARARAKAIKQVPSTSYASIQHKHPIVTANAASELRGIAEAVVQRAVRSVSAGILSKQRPRQIAAGIVGVILTVGRTRSRAMADLSISQAYNTAALDMFKTLGLTKVGIEAERLLKSTSKDSVATDISIGSLIRQALGAKAKLEGAEVVEVLTAGDDDVCQECEDIADEGPYDIDEAFGLIPAHPNCRCAFVPFYDERFAEQERDT